MDQDQRGGGVGSARVRVAEAWVRRRGYSEIASDGLLVGRYRSVLAVLNAVHRPLGFEEVKRAAHCRKAF